MFKRMYGITALLAFCWVSSSHSFDQPKAKMLPIELKLTRNEEGDLVVSAKNVTKETIEWEYTSVSFEGISFTVTDSKREKIELFCYSSLVSPSLIKKKAKIEPGQFLQDKVPTSFFLDKHLGKERLVVAMIKVKETECLSPSLQLP